VPFVIGFHPRLRTLGNILRKHFHILTANPLLKLSFPEVPIVAFRRLPNIRDKLVHTSLKGEENRDTSGVKRCQDPRCKCCPTDSRGDGESNQWKKSSNTKRRYLQDQKT
jgi:hypothetical protein